MDILIVVVLLFSGELEYKKFNYENNEKTVNEYIVKCDQFANKIKKEISYFTWNYKNQGSLSRGYYLKDDTGIIIATIC